MAKLKGLGRGLDALLSGTDDAASSESLQSIALEHLLPGKYQPRTRMDDVTLGELAESIKAQGVMQPILVRPVGSGRFEIIAGERRWRAAQRAGLKLIPALVRNVPDQAALALSLIENIQREDLNPLEEAQGIARLIEEFKLTHDTAAAAIGRSRSAVSNLLRLLQLAEPVRTLLLADKLDMGHARALLALSAANQVSAAGRIVAQSLSVRDSERLVHALLAPSARRVKHSRKAPDGDVARIERDLADVLGAGVRIESTRKGAGRVVIAYSSLEQLDGILDRLRKGSLA
jgi:ParB family chromosome partitioning protein